MGIRIVTDSASDLNNEIEKKFNITIVPLSVNFDQQSYQDRYEITSEEFFNKLEVFEGIPSTSQVNPKQFEDVFQTILSEGDEILGIFLSSELSGTYHSAMIAKDVLKSDKITIIDSQLVSLSEGLLVYEAAKMIDCGSSIKDVIGSLQNMIKNMKTIIVVDTLEYLKKGGRLSVSQAFIGGILNLKPILTLVDGKILAIDKVRGRKKVLNWIRKWIADNHIKLSDKTIYMLDAKDAEYLEELKQIFIKEYGVKDIIQSHVGAIVGTHCGPGAIGFCFIDDMDGNPS